MGKTLQGRFRPRNPQKYKGNAGNIHYRSSWEQTFMRWCDSNTHVHQWMSEERAIWYFDPVSKKKRRYFPDFIIKYVRDDGIICEEVIEIKPKKHVDGPNPNPKEKNKGVGEVSVNTYVTNMAKWKAAAEWASDRGMSFRLITEKELNV